MLTLEQHREMAISHFKNLSAENQLNQMDYLGLEFKSVHKNPKAINKRIA